MYFRVNIIVIVIIIIIIIIIGVPGRTRLSPAVPGVIQVVPGVLEILAKLVESRFYQILSCVYVLDDFINTHFKKRPRIPTSNNSDATGHSTTSSAAANNSAANNAKAKENDTKTTQENARVAAVSSSDIFSRAELELQKKRPNDPSTSHDATKFTKHTRISFTIGQFDLAATANT